MFSRLMEEKLLKNKKSSLSQLLKCLKSAAEAKGWSLEQRTARMKEREKKVVAKCFHGAGIVVPIDKNGVGYRPLPETPGTSVFIVLSTVKHRRFHSQSYWRLAVWPLVGVVRVVCSEGRSLAVWHFDSRIQHLVLNWYYCVVSCCGTFHRRFTVHYSLFRAHHCLFGDVVLRSWHNNTRKCSFDLGVCLRTSCMVVLVLSWTIESRDELEMMRGCSLRQNSTFLFFDASFLVPHYALYDLHSSEEVLLEIITEILL